MHYRLVVFCICLLSATNIFAQDTLPRFSAISKGNGKVIISWRNEFRSLSQISIQRSFDSIKNFTSLITVPDPSIAQNGFVDAKAPNPGMYYRLFIVMENGSYLFTKSKKASAAELQLPIENEPADKNEIKLKSEDQRITYHQKSNAAKISGPAKINGAPTVEVDKIIFITRNDSLIGQVSGKTLKHFRDSIINKTKDTLAFIESDTIQIKSFVPKEVYKISNYVYTTKDGNISISLPYAHSKKYSVKFFELDLSPLFDIKEVKDILLIVDKTNFLHSGWFRFELYEDGKLKEKNKLFIPKDF